MKIKKFLDIYISLVITIILTVFASIALYGKYGIDVYISFLCVIISNMILMLNCFKNKDNYFEIIILSFYTLFFIIAPILQISKYKFPTTFLIREDYLVIANICNFVFMISYIFFRYINLNKYKTILNTKKEEKILDFKLNKLTIMFMCIIFLTYFIPNFKDIIYQILNRTSTDGESLNQVSHLIINKFIMFIPLLFVYYFINEYRVTKEKKYIMLIIIWFIILLICKNPFNEKRNALGPIYLSIILYIYMDRINPRTIYIIFTTVFIVFLPITSLITHTEYGLNSIVYAFKDGFNSDIIMKQFFELHFDAYANLNAAIEYVKLNGISYGIQLIGSILFFIPRSIWNMKPLSSGIVTGNYLMQNYSFHFNNLSCPITAEGYYNFGIVGVIFLAFLLSKLSKKVKQMSKYNSYYRLLACYIIVHLFFLMRGDLMNGIAYLIGPMCALYFLPQSLNKIFKCII